MTSEKRHLQFRTNPVDNGYIDVNCNLCGSDDYNLFALDNSNSDQVLHRTRVRCKKCGLVYSNPQATIEKMKDFYSKTFPSSCWPQLLENSEDNIRSNRQFFKELNSRMEPGRFLDIGCGPGHLLKIGLEFGWETYGVEISPEFVKHAREQLNLKNVFLGELHGAHFEDRFFDYVHIWHTLEHTQNPTGVLVEIKRILKDNGELRIGVPNIDEPYKKLQRLHAKIKRKTPGMPSGNFHTFDFTPTTVSKMLKNAGFDIKKITVYYRPLDDSYYKDKDLKIRMIKVFLYYLNLVFPYKFGNFLSIWALKKLDGWNSLS